MGEDKLCFKSTIHLFCPNVCCEYVCAVCLVEVNKYVAEKSAKHAQLQLASSLFTGKLAKLTLPTLHYLVPVRSLLLPVVMPVNSCGTKTKALINLIALVSRLLDKAGRVQVRSVAHLRTPASQSVIVVFVILQSKVEYSYSKQALLTPK